MNPFRALEAGCRRPLLVRPIDDSFPKAGQTATLGALHALYVVSKELIIRNHTLAILNCIDNYTNNLCWKLYQKFVVKTIPKICIENHTKNLYWKPYQQSALEFENHTKDLYWKSYQQFSLKFNNDTNNLSWKPYQQFGLKTIPTIWFEI